ncbi:MAG: hypothetical protein CVU22_20525 [Betaproteobacteria bacterium HGW-Betaproteobacteria-16]|nr:MAG: hypothetical protein CVU22_20525 [Betaproteobacteria bacterium HGW-Betaproteobacteria-16]
MRRVLVLFLCLLMPLQGYAALGMETAPCPMQSRMDMKGDSDAFAQVMEDCCNDLATFERTGEACKSDQACAAPVAWSIPLQALAFLAQAPHALSSPAWRTLPPGLPTSLWRPPTSI